MDAILPDTRGVWFERLFRQARTLRQAARPNEHVQPKISIVLPVYNQAKYLADGIRSIERATTFPFEIVLVDDGSTDHIIEVLKPYETNAHLRVILQKNRGLSHALNAGFEFASGVFVTWTSADNLYLPGALDCLAYALMKQPAVAMVYGNVQLIDETGKPARDTNYRKNEQAPHDNSVLLLPRAAETLSSYNDNFINACFLMRRQYALMVGGYAQVYNGFEDYDFWLRLSAIASLKHVGLEQALYQYRLHENTLTHKLEMPKVRVSQPSAILRAEQIREGLEEQQLYISGGPHMPVLPGLHHKSTLLPEGEYQISSNESERILQLTRIGPPSPKLKHSHLNRYYYPNFQEPLQAELVGIPDSSLAPSGILFPPLRFPAMLRRARDSSLGAVQAHQRSLGSLLYFCPDGLEGNEWELSQIVKCVSKASDYTWVLFARSSSQRLFADRVNISLTSNTNLRIVDVSNESAADWEPLREEVLADKPWQERSLLFVLSGVDAVFALSQNPSAIQALLQIRAEIGLAAMAGIPLVVGTDHFAPNSEARIAFDAPHIQLTELENPTKRLDIQAPSVESVDAWLRENSIQRYREHVLAILHGAIVER